MSLDILTISWNFIGGKAHGNDETIILAKVVSGLILIILFVDRYLWILKSTKLSIFNQWDINKKNKRYVLRYGMGPSSEYHKKIATNGQQTKRLFVNQFFFVTSNDKLWMYSNEIDLFLLELTFKVLLHFQLIIQSKI